MNQDPLAVLIRRALATQQDNERYISRLDEYVTDTRVRDGFVRGLFVGILVSAAIVLAAYYCLIYKGELCYIF